MARLTEDEKKRFKEKFPELVKFLTSEDFAHRVLNNSPAWAVQKDGGVSYKRAISASVISAVKANPALLVQCSIPSLFDAVGAIVRRGLTVGDNVSWLVPYKGMVSFHLGWMGLYQLAQRVGLILNARTQPFYEHDAVNIRLGSDCGVDHTPAAPGTPRGKFAGAYLLMTLPDGVQDIEYMDAAEIELIRSRSPGRDSDAWKLWPTEMGRAKVMKRGLKRVPKPLEYDPSLMLDMDDGVVIEDGEETVHQDRPALAAPTEKPMSGLTGFVQEQREKQRAPAQTVSDYDDYLAEGFDPETGEVEQTKPKDETKPPADPPADDTQDGANEAVSLILPGSKKPQMMARKKAAQELVAACSQQVGPKAPEWLKAALTANAAWLRDEEVTLNVIEGLIERFERDMKGGGGLDV